MDPTNIVSVSSSAVSFLSRYWKEINNEEDAVAKLYDVIKRKFSNNPPAAELLNDFEKAPDDLDTQASVRLLIKKSMMSDVEFATTLEKLIESHPEIGETALDRVKKILASKSSLGSIVGGAFIGSALIPGVGSVIGAVAGALAISLLDSEVLQEFVENSKSKSEQVEK